MKNYAKRSIPMAAALAVALLVGGTAFAQGANGSVNSATNANAANSESTTKGSKAATGGSDAAMAPKVTPGKMSESTIPGSTPATGGSMGMKAPKGDTDTARMGDGKVPSTVQRTDAMAKPKMTAEQRASRRAARKAAKMAKRNAETSALPKEDLGMVKP